ncbi:MAG: hypothetical protein ACYSWP_13025 [Planctomycetota bacterium]|jgi:hypothetical protein
MKLAVMITNEYFWELKALSHLMKILWPEQEITVVGPHEPPIKCNWMKTQWNTPEYSKGLIHFLNEIDDPLVMKIDADHWPTGRVNVNDLAVIERYMLANPDVIRCQINTGGGFFERASGPREQFENLTFAWCPKSLPDCFLQMSVVPAMWNRIKLLNVIKPGWDPWMTELEGSKELINNHPNLRSVAVDHPPYPFAHVARTRDKKVKLSAFPLSDEIKQFVPEDFEIL